MYVTQQPASVGKSFYTRSRSVACHCRLHVAPLNHLKGLAIAADAVML